MIAVGTSGGSILLLLAISGVSVVAGESAQLIARKNGLSETESMFIGVAAGAVTEIGLSKALVAMSKKGVIKLGKGVFESTKSVNDLVEPNQLDEIVEVGDDAAKAYHGGSKTINTLTDAQKSRLKSLENTINDHLTEGDFSGTLRDLQGNPVPNGKGGYFDHLGEMKDSYAALNKIKKGLEGSLKNPNLSEVDRKLLQEGLDNVNSYISRIDDMFEPFGGIN